MPKCPECGKVLKNAFAMKIHVGRMHKKGKPPKVAKPVASAGLAVSALDIDALVSLKQQVDARLAEIARQLRLAGAMYEKPGRKPGKRVQAGAPAARKRKKRGVFKVTGEQMILDLLAGGKSLTTAELGKAWKAAGRGGKADNPLTKLVKAKKVKRTPNKGGQGSSYSLA